jgi:hypothetical protein
VISGASEQDNDARQAQAERDYADWLNIQLNVCDISAHCSDWESIVQIASMASGRGPVGRRGGEINSTARYDPATIAGRDYTGHAIRRMHERGIPPSVIENTIRSKNYAGPGSAQNSAAYRDPVNGITVSVDATTGRVITVEYSR